MRSDRSKTSGRDKKGQTAGVCAENGDYSCVPPTRVRFQLVSGSRRVGVIGVAEGQERKSEPIFDFLHACSVRNVLSPQ